MTEYWNELGGGKMTIRVLKKQRDRQYSYLRVSNSDFYGLALNHTHIQSSVVNISGPGYINYRRFRLVKHWSGFFVLAQTEEEE